MIDLKELLIAEHNGDQLEIETVLERLTRYQQIVGGNFPYEVEDGYRTKPFEHNPKLDALVELIEDLPHTEKVIIWTRFKPEIKAVVEALVPFGKSVQFHGGIDFDGRKAAVDNFQNGDARFFVSNPTVGGMGLTLTAATTAIYYSNTFSYQDRVQSEDRCHRKGTVNAVTYIDIVMNHPIDKLIIRTLKNKTSMAAYVKQALGERQ
jgi:SNF2 family DNA or RNA helicase